MAEEKSETAKIVEKDNEVEDLVDAGFKRLDNKLMKKRPGAIKWGRLYQGFSAKEKIKYLEKLAFTMNDAAATLQEERNLLNELCAKKEEQIQQLNKAISQNNMMLQSEVSRMNEERQAFNAESAKLRKQIKELEIVVA